VPGLLKFPAIETQPHQEIFRQISESLFKEVSFKEQCEVERFKEREEGRIGGVEICQHCAIIEIVRVKPMKRFEKPVQKLRWCLNQKLVRVG